MRPARSPLLLLWLSVAVGLSLGCGGDAGGPDGGSQGDAGTRDAGTQDAGSTNQAPSWGTLELAPVAEGSDSTAALAATDADGDPLTYSLVSGPPFAEVAGSGLRLAPSFEVVTGVAQSAEFSLTLAVTDGHPGHLREATFSVTVTNTNRAPRFASIDPASLFAGDTTTRTVSASDPDGDAVTVSLAAGTPAWISLEGEVLTLAPPPGLTFDARVVLSASDGATSNGTSFQVTVTVPPNRAPSLAAISAVSLIAGESAQRSLSASDPDGDAVSLTVSGNAPAWVTRSGEVLTFAPPPGTTFDQTLTVTASDGALSTQQSFRLTVTLPENLAPTVSDLQQLDGAGNPVAAGHTSLSPPSLRATVADAEGDLTDLQAEVRRVEESYTGTPNYTANQQAAPGVRTLTLPSLAVGTYKWRVRARSSDGKTSAWSDFAEGAAAFTVEAAAITGSIVINDGAAATKDRTLNLTLAASSNAGAITQMRLRINLSSYLAYTPFSPTATVTLPASLADGSVRISVEFVDAAGTRATFNDTIRLDTTGPALSAPFAINGGAAGANSAAVSLDYAASDPSGITVEEASHDGTSWTAISGPAAAWTIDATTEGMRSVHLRLTDALGNVSQFEDSIEYDVTPPTVSVAAAGTGLAAGAVYATALTVIFNHTASDSGSGLAQVCTGPTSLVPNCVAYTPTPQVTFSTADGLKTHHLQVVDGAGNRSEVVSDTIILDRTPPTVTSVVVNGGAESTTVRQVEVLVAASDANGVPTLRLAASSAWNSQPYLGAETPHLINLGTSEGTYTVLASVIDAAGNVSAGPPWPGDQIHFDTPPPVYANGIRYTNQRLYTVSLSSNQICSGISWVLLPASAPAPTSPGEFSPILVPQSGSTSLEIDLGDTDGDLRFYAWLKDLNGHVSTAPAVVSVWLDTTPPAPPSLDSLVQTTINQLTFAYSAAADLDPLGAPGAGVLRHEFGVALQSGGPYTWRTASSTSPADVTELANDFTHFVVMRAVDRAGNVSASSNELSGTPYWPWEFQHHLPTANELHGLAYDAVNGRWLVSGTHGALYSSVDLVSWQRLDSRSNAILYSLHVGTGGVWAMGAPFLVRNAGPAAPFEIVPLSASGGARALAEVGVDGNGATRWVAVGGSGTVYVGSSVGTEAPVFSPRSSTTTYDPLHAVTGCLGGPTECAQPGVVIASGGRARVMRSTNFGETWGGVSLPPGYVTAFPDRDWSCTGLVHVPGTDTLYLGCEYFGTSSLRGLLVSTNGGRSFTTDPVFNRQDVTALALAGDTLWIGSENGSFSDGNVHTYRGGVLTNVTPPEMLLGGPWGIIPNRIVARSEDEAVVLAYEGDGNGLDHSRIWHTTDRGVTWQRVSPFDEGTLDSLVTSDGTTLVAASTRTVLRSEDSGQSWSQVFEAPSDKLLYGMDLTHTGEDGVGFAVGYAGYVVKTTDGGRTWAPDPQSGTLRTLNEVSCATSTFCVAVGPARTIYRWDGTTWTLAVSGYTNEAEYFDVEAYLDDDGVQRAIAVSHSSSVARFDGATWTETPVGFSLSHLGVKRDGSGIILSGGRRSTDHGQTWSTGGTASRGVLHIAGTDTWYALGSDSLYGSVRKSTDDGVTFRTLSSVGTSRPLSAIAGVVEEEVWVSGRDGLVVRTVTGGE